MKKLIIASFVAALFAACNNTPAVNESAVKVASLTSWVDSIKNVISTSTTHDSASWAGFNAQFTDAVAAIKVEELDEASKTALTAAQTAWTDAGTNYTAKMAEEMAAAKAAADTMAPVAPVEGMDKMKEGAKEMKEGAKEMMKK